jgi:uncharacterized protein with NRDE domain
MKEDNVIKFPGKLKRTNISLERVCDLAKKRLEQAVIMGINKEGKVQMITTFEDPAEVLWYLESAKQGLMQNVYLEEGELDEEE